MKKIKFTQLLSISMMLFAIFFGAGNMIFPPAMGQLAGTNFLPALAGFVLTDAGIAILGITAIVLIGTSMSDLGMLIGKKFALCLSIGVYLLIGPLFALPRTGSVSYEIAILPYLGKNHHLLFSIIFTAIFFLVTYYLSSNPNKIVDVVGKYLTPVLLISILLIFVFSILKGEIQGGLEFGTIHAPQGEYASIPFFKGMIEGYNAIDGPAGLAFAIIVITAIKGYGITNKNDIAKYTILCGLGAACFLTVVYFMLTYIGAITNTPFSNGGALLHAVTNQLFGSGGILLGIAVLLACLTTSIGLTTSFADYFHTILPSFSHKKLAALVCLFSFVISNIGLSQLIQISLPVLIMIYPVTVVLLLLSFLKKYIAHRKMVYVLAMLFTFIITFVNGLDSIHITLGPMSQICQMLPFNSLSIGWILPAIVGALLGLLPFWTINKSRNEKMCTQTNNPL